MSHSTPSALITDQGRRIQFRIRSRVYEISQEELRTLLDVPPGSPGLGITIDRDRLLFEFADNHSKELSETVARAVDRNEKDVGNFYGRVSSAS